ncbi:MAG: molybdate ABC transporter substrate-binding protein [Gammaproteobacteria bacterium]|nr:MAG: molybdate ABC transporter substrate-binding protein [Gammaproteobacteria bacterium]
MRRIWVLLIGVTISLCAAEATTLNVAAASDLRFVLPKIIAAWQAEVGPVSVRVAYGSSGRLYRQIQHGAPFDVFLSADETFPRRLQQQNIAGRTLYQYARGRLVVYARSGDSKCLSLTRLVACEGRIVIANPEHAPYGMRAREAMLALDVWAKLKPRLIFAENIAQAAQYVARGEVAYAVLARSLVSSPMLSDGRWQAVPENSHQPLQQAGVVIGDAPPSQAVSFMQFLQSRQAQTLFEKFGFQPIGASSGER